jgi:hypothetical protein
MRRSNPMPIARNRLKTAQDYEWARIMLAELEGKITPEQADAMHRELKKQPQTNK